ncbi:hypothetical protein [Aquamicrobium soli]|uniref:Glyoxalase-like domain-containing protein n=1 Tax=Aquamicrobium soli TaxID=1811518 RepID=A0ABV7KAQ1_9HYPH
MIDHLVHCATQDDADALMEQYGSSRAYQPRVILQDAVWDMADPENPVLVSAEVTASGYHVWIALDALDEALRDLPDNACRLIGDRSLCGSGATWQDVLLYHGADISSEVLSSARVDPVPAGTDYPWRVVP